MTQTTQHIADWLVEYADDFLGHRELSTSKGDGWGWLIDDTSAAGTPTYVIGGVGGVATLTLAADNEVENVCLHHGDDLNFDIDLIESIEVGVKMGQATIDAATQLAIGLASARNDTVDDIAEAALFRLIGADSTSLLVVETDDGTTNNDDVATSKSLTNAAYVHLKISFAGGKSNVKFLVNGEHVASGTTFDMSGYSGALQPIIQLQKSADTNTDSVLIDYVVIKSRRA